MDCEGSSPIVNVGNLDGASGGAAHIFEHLVSGSLPEKNTAAKTAKEFEESDQDSLFELLGRNLEQHPNTKAAYDAYRILIEAGVSNAASRYASALAEAPPTQIPPAAGTDVDTLLKSKPELSGFLSPVIAKLIKTDTQVGKAHGSTGEGRDEVMGTSADFSAPPNWGGMKGDVTRSGHRPLTPTICQSLLSEYISQSGGARSISSGSGPFGSGSTARSAARSLGGFISSVGREGLDSTLHANGLQDLAGGT